jgi:hypothetical protein
VSISSRTDLLEVLLQLGRQRAVEIIGNVGDPEEVLPKPTLFSRRLIRNQLGFRFACLGDDDLLAGGGAVDQLGEIGLRIVDAGGIGHCRAEAASHVLTGSTNT